MIERKEYMNLLEKWRDKKAIKVVTGIRRCGKSSLLRMFRRNFSRTEYPKNKYRTSTSRISTTNRSSTIKFCTRT